MRPTPECAMHSEFWEIGLSLLLRFPRTHRQLNSSSVMVFADAMMAAALFNLNFFRSIFVRRFIYHDLALPRTPRARPPRLLRDLHSKLQTNTASGSITRPARVPGALRARPPVKSVCIMATLLLALLIIRLSTIPPVIFSVCELSGGGSFVE